MKASSQPFLILAFIFTMCCRNSRAQSNTIQQLNGHRISFGQIDQVVSDLMKEGHVDGLCLSILNENKPVYTHAYGYKNKDQGSLLDTATVIYAASFSKALFAFVTSRLIEKGVIDPDKPLYQYLPKPIPSYTHFKELAGDERWKLFTARMCLSHTTGLPNIWWLNPHTGAIDTTAPLQIYFTPGSRYAYSGEGLKLLQLVLETITGKNLEKLAEEEVFMPAGMNRTGYVWQPAFDTNYAAGHNESGKAMYKQKPTNPGAAGSMFTTIADYSRFIAYLMQGKGLSAKMKEAMLTPQVTIHSAYQFPTITEETTDRDQKISLSYGLGWGLMKTPYGPAFFKEGHDDNWRNYNINFPGKKLSIIIMCNSANGEGIFKELLEKLIGDSFTPWEWERYTPVRNTAS